MHSDWARSPGRIRKQLVARAQVAALGGDVGILYITMAADRQQVQDNMS
jgi:hypothetical protein